MIKRPSLILLRSRTPDWNSIPARILIRFPCNQWRLLVLCLLPFLFANDAPAEEIGLDEAILKSLAQNPIVEVNRAVVEEQEGVALTTSGSFDWLVSGGLLAEDTRVPDLSPTSPPAGAGFDPFRQEERVLLEGGVTRQFRNGFILSPNFQILLLENDRGIQDPVGTSTLNLDLIVPLLRGAGAKTVGAPEQAAQVNLEAARLFFKFQLSEQAFLTLAAYWEYAANRERLEILQEIEERSRSLRQTVTRLVEDRILSPVEQVQAEANFYSKEAIRIDAELGLSQSRYFFGQVLGLPPQSLPDTPSAADALPVLASLEPLAQLAGAQDYIAYALEHRADRAAIRLNAEAADLLSLAARRNLQPQVDMNFRVGYSGFNEGSSLLEPLGSNLQGLNLQGGIQMEWPVQNRIQRGLLRQQLAREAQLRYQGNRLEQQIALEVLTALETVQKRGRQAVAATAASEAYQRAVALEQKRFGVGDSSFLDVVQLENLYLDSRLEALEARVRFAIAVGRLRFSLGAIFQEMDNENRAYQLEDLTNPLITNPGL